MTFGIWQLIIMLIIVIGVPVAAMATERSGKKQTRRVLARWIGILILYAIITDVILRLAGGIAPILSIILLIVGLGVTAGFYRAIVRRCNDAGIGKWLAYVAIIPIIVVGVVIFLLFKPSVSTA